MTHDEVVQLLLKTRASIRDIRAPQRSGIYALYLKKGSKIESLGLQSNTLLYIGSSSNLAERGHENHFNSDSTGFSTVRRTFGAIQKSNFNMKAIPRSPGNSNTNITNYKFLPEGEKRLTEWMTNNLEIGMCPIFENYKYIEKGLINHLHPPLNLTGWVNPLRQKIMSLRKICSDEARKNAG